MKRRRASVNHALVLALLVLGLEFVGPPTLAAQNEGQLEGRVLRADGTPLGGGDGCNSGSRRCRVDRRRRQLSVHRPDARTLLGAVESLGGRGRFTVGEGDSLRVDARHAAALGNGWYFKAAGGYLESDDFFVSRVDEVEYEPDLLSRERVAPPLDRIKIGYGSLRFDKYFVNEDALAVEYGMTDREGPVDTSAGGRFQNTDSRFPWARASFTSRRWKALNYVTAADVDDYLSLSSACLTYERGYNLGMEGSEWC